MGRSFGALLEVKLSTRGVVKENLNSSGTIGKLVGVFSRKESELMVKQAEQIGFHTLVSPSSKEPVQLPDQVRVHDELFAKMLFDRVESILEPIHKEVHPLQTWKVDHLHPLMTFLRYNPNIAYKPQRSIWEGEGNNVYTMLVFLNDSFSGGDTEFPNCSIDPTIGDGVVFYSKFSRSVAPVTKESQYVLQADIIYKPLPKH